LKLFIKQHIFTWGDKFSVYDENGNIRYTVEGEVFTFGKKLHLFDEYENEVAFIHQKLFSFLPSYFISRGGEDIAEVVKEFTFFKQEYTVEGLGWSVTGDFWDHEYSIYHNGVTVAQVSREWFTLGDAYSIDIESSLDEVTVLSVVLVIDAVISAQRNN